MKKRISVWQILSIGYLLVITIGTLLLLLPVSTKNGSTTFINALFTSTSATCVTGLVVYDTNTHWTLFGQIVIILLIQIGGLGFMTLVTVMLNILGKKLTLAQKVTISQTTNYNNYSNMKELIRSIFIGTIIIELIGALFLSIRFIPCFGTLKGIYYSLWHSVSAFCNAGFDIMGGTLGGGEFCSFSGFYNDPLVLLTLSALISSGGIGFCVLRDLFYSKFNFKKLQLHSKITISVNTFLIVCSTVLFMVFERNYTNKDMNFFNQILVSFFNSITPRTAGFSIVDTSKMSDSSYILNLFLMFVGGSSGSTAGGIKVGTFAIIIFGMKATFTGKNDVTIFKKRISTSQVATALTLLMSYLMFATVSCILICALEIGAPDVTSVLSVKQIAFECVSALCTVGSSLSVTTLLCTGSKIILLILMYAGRVGIVTIGLALAKSNRPTDIKYPLDNIYIV